MIAIRATSRYTFLYLNVSICIKLSRDTSCLHL